MTLKYAMHGMDDHGHLQLFRAMMHHVNLPEDPRQIDVADDYKQQDEPLEEPMPDPNDWGEFQRDPMSFTSLLLRGLAQAGPSADQPESSNAGRPHRQVNSPDRFTYSPFIRRRGRGRR